MSEEKTKIDVMSQYKNSKIVTTVLFTIIFLLLNYISYGLFTRFDISRSGKLRLTNATKKVIRNLPDKAMIEAFISGDMPEKAISMVKQVKDFLREYSISSNGKVKLVFLDPDDDDDAKKKAKEYQIKESILSMTDEKTSLRQSKYFALVLSYGGLTKKIESLERTPKLEYDLTNSIYNMAYPQQNKIAFLADNTKFKKDTQAHFMGLRALHGYISVYYKNVEELSLSSVAEISSSYGALVIPQVFQLSDQDKYKIDQYIMNGGNVIILSSGFDFDATRWSGSALDDKVLDFFKHYGIAFSKGAVIEMDQEYAGKIPVNMFQDMPYPAWIIPDKDLINENAVVSKGARKLFFPWTSAITINKSNFKIDKKEAVKATILVKTSNQAKILPQIMLHPQQLPKMLGIGSKQKTGVQNLAVQLEGKFQSYFNGKKLPQVNTSNFKTKSTKKSFIFAVASPFAFSDNAYLQYRRYLYGLLQSNFDMFMSFLDLSFGREELIEARHRDVSDVVMGNTSGFWKKTMTGLNFILPLLIMAAIGFLRFGKRKKLAQKEYKKLA